jgi:hypothetical protein
MERVKEGEYDRCTLYICMKIELGEMPVILATLEAEIGRFQFFLIKIFIRIYSLYGGIRTDNSGYIYIVHYLYCPHHLSPSDPSLPHLKQLQEVF